MVIALFGATGRTGKPLLEKALAAGHAVQTLTRSPNKFSAYLAKNFTSTQQDKVKIIQGDIKDPQAVINTVQGSDVVISVVGHSDPFPWVKNKTAPDMQTVGIQNIIAAMKQSGVTRIYTLTGSGVRFPGDKPSLIDKFVNAMLGMVASDRINDGERHARILAETDLDWTIMRAFLLTERREQGKYKYGKVGDKGLGFLVDRADVAQFVLDTVTNEKLYQTAPYLSS